MTGDHTDIRCAECDDDLRGITGEDVCPECGCAERQSMGPGSTWQQDPNIFSWLRTMWGLIRRPRRTIADIRPGWRPVTLAWNLFFLTVVTAGWGLVIVAPFAAVGAALIWAPSANAPGKASRSHQFQILGHALLVPCFGFIAAWTVTLAGVGIALLLYDPIAAYYFPAPAGQGARSQHLSELVLVTSVVVSCGILVLTLILSVVLCWRARRFVRRRYPDDRAGTPTTT